MAYAKAMYDTAVSYFMRYELDSGEVYLDEALAIFEEHQVWALYAAAKTDKIQLGMMQGRSGMDALQDYRQIEKEVLPKLDEVGELHAKTHYHIGLHYYYTGQYTRAEEHMRRSLKAMEHLGAGFDYRRADVLNLLANVNRMLNRTDLVIASYEEAIAAGERADPDDYQGSLQKRANLIDAWASLDSIGPIIDQMAIIEGFAPRLDQNDRLSQAILAETRIKYLVAQGMIPEALDGYLAIEFEHPTFYTANDQRERLITTQARLARQLGKKDLAARILDDATRDPVLRNSENIYKAMAVYALEDGKPTEGLRFSRKMESLALPEGREAVEKGSDLSYGSFASLTAIRYVVRSLDALADSSGDLRYNREVLDYIQSFGRMLDILRRKADLGELISLRDEVWIEVYELGIKSALRLHDHSKETEFLEVAWNMAEAAKAAVLLGSVNRIDPAEVEGAPAELIAKELAIKSELLYVKSEMEADLDSTGEWRRKHLALYSALDSVMVDYEENHPEYTRRRFSPVLTSLQEARESVIDGELLISYFYGQDQVYGMAVSSAGVTLKELGQRRTIQALLSDFREELNTRPTPEVFSRRMDRLYGIGAELYSTLLAPLLPGAGLPQRLTVIPDGALSYIPFAALPISGSLSQAGRPEYLAERTQIRYSYAYTALKQAENSLNRTFKGDILAIAPVFTGSKMDASGGQSWGPIPGAAQEVDHLSRLFPHATTRIDTSNRNWFMERAGQHSIIHLATHAYSHPEDPFSSALLLDGGANAGVEGVLRTADLYTMSIPAHLVVLSACNTGDGPVKRGEGVMSIAHAFSYAGSPSVVMTLWPANDATIQAIISEFYNELAAGASKSLALSSAQRAYLEVADPYHAHPYFWAGVVSFGDDRPLELATDHGRKWLWLIGSGILLMAFLGFWWRKRTRAR